MADIQVKRSHTLGKQQAREVAEQVAEKLKDRIQVKAHWDGDTLRFERKGASGFIAVSDDAVDVEISLALMFKPMKGMIEGKVREYLDERLR